MRVTHSMLVRNTLIRVNQNKTNLNDLNNAISTGKKLIEASDDPVNFTRVSKFKTTISQYEQYMRTINGANGWAETTESALQEIISLVKDAKDVAIRGADASTFEPTREALAQTIDAKIGELIDQANTKYAGKNIFAGTETQIGRAFSISGDVVTYVGNTEQINRKIADNLNLSINITGQEIMDTGIFSALTDLRAALNNDDLTTINASIDVLATVEENLLHLSTESGLVMNQLSLTEGRLESTIYDLEKFVSRDEDVDMAEAIVKYESEEIAYQAAMQAATKILKLNIMDYLA